LLSRKFTGEWVESSQGRRIDRRLDKIYIVTGFKVIGEEDNKMLVVVYLHGSTSEKVELTVDLLKPPQSGAVGGWEFHKQLYNKKGFQILQSPFIFN